MDNEIFDIGKLRLCVNGEHKFTTDSVLLAEFTAPHKNDVICDLCTGCGIVPFLLINEKNAPSKLFAVDISESAIGLLRESVAMNGLSERIIPVLEDLKNITQIPAGFVDIVTVNPPYFKANDGFKRQNGGTARHELLCELDDVIKAAARLLKFGGRLKMCHVPERLSDVVCTLRKYNLEPKNIKLVSGTDGFARLMLIDAKKGGRAGVKISIGS